MKLESPPVYEDAKCQQTRSERHIEIDMALEELESVLDRLNSLMMRITEQDEAGYAQAEKPTPSLAMVLESTPNRIREFTKSATSKIEEIAQALF